MKKISVIIPVYNSASYLEKCLDSVVNQTYFNLEIILINDGSTDDSASIVDQYKEKDSRIIVVHKSNGGIGSAYKAACEIMTGDYVSFIDSDDYVALNYYEDIIKIIYKQNPDVIHFSRVLFNDLGVIKDELTKFNTIIEGNDTILKHHFDCVKDPSLACRVFKKDLFNNLVIFNQNIGIDEILIIQLLAQCEKVVFTDKIYYYTYERPDSVSRIQYSEQKTNQGIKVYQFACEFLSKNKAQYAPYFHLKYLNYLLPIYEFSLNDENIKHSELLNLMKEEINKQYQHVCNTSHFKSLPLLFKIKAHAISKNKLLYLLITKGIKLKKIIIK
jgi:glycosyltransferase involved in cell wall biosynthesis